MRSEDIYRHIKSLTENERKRLIDWCDNMPKQKSYLALIRVIIRSRRFHMESIARRFGRSRDLTVATMHYLPEVVLKALYPDPSDVDVRLACFIRAVRDTMGRGNLPMAIHYLNQGKVLAWEYHRVEQLGPLQELHQEIGRLSPTHRPDLEETNEINRFRRLHLQVSSLADHLEQARHLPAEERNFKVRSILQDELLKTEENLPVRIEIERGLLLRRAYIWLGEFWSALRIGIHLENILQEEHDHQPKGRLLRIRNIGLVIGLHAFLENTEEMEKWIWKIRRIETKVLSEEAAIFEEVAVLSVTHAGDSGVSRLGDLVIDDVKKSKVLMGMLPERYRANLWFFTGRFAFYTEKYEESLRLFDRYSLQGREMDWWLGLYKALIFLELEEDVYPLLNRLRKKGRDLDLPELVTATKAIIQWLNTPVGEWKSFAIETIDRLSFYWRSPKYFDLIAWIKWKCDFGNDSLLERVHQRHQENLRGQSRSESSSQNV